MDVPRGQGRRRLVQRHAGRGAGPLHPGERHAGRPEDPRAGGGRTPIPTRRSCTTCTACAGTSRDTCAAWSSCAAFGFSVFAIDYRGFGKSDGELPSEQMTLRGRGRGLGMAREAGARPVAAASSTGIRSAARSRSTSRRGSPRRRTGTPQARGLIVESTFTSLPDIAAELSWSWLPTRLIMSQRYDSIEKIRSGRRPDPVRARHGRPLRARASSRRRCSTRRPAPRGSC